MNFGQNLFNWGSSPHARGILKADEESIVHLRIIPAYAGNTPCLPQSGRGRGDHPRLRGEHAERPSCLLALAGSPPPTRGTLRVVTHVDHRHGITPAYAGNTCDAENAVPQSRDHPRLRGEHLGLIEKVSGDSGSPPPTRGTQRVKVDLLLGVGITPAYAGNT